MITHKQLTLAEIFEDCQNKFDNDKYQFLSLLDEAINLDEIVPVSFVSHFHAQTGRPRKHQLYPMLKALLLQRIFSIPTDTLLIVFLKCSQELRDFCGFDVVPDGSKFTRFKQDFLLDLQSMFNHLVDLTEPICQKLNPALADMTIFDTSGIEAWVMENNPKGVLISSFLISFIFILILALFSCPANSFRVHLFLFIAVLLQSS